MRLALALALATLATPGAAALALLDAPGPARVEAASAVHAWLVDRDGRAARVAWTPPEGDARTVDVPRGGVALALEAGLHRLEPAPRSGGGVLLLTVEGEGGVAVEVPATRGLAAAPPAALALAAAGILAPCTRKFKRPQQKRRAIRPEDLRRDR